MCHDFEAKELTARTIARRATFPLLRSVVEFSYIGTVVGTPPPVTQEFHRSMAGLSTMLVLRPRILFWSYRQWTN
jgi:hypothetical protein